MTAPGRSERRRAERVAAAPPVPSPDAPSGRAAAQPVVDDGAGPGLLALATGGTATFVAVAVAGALWRSTFSAVVVAVSLLLFAAGCAAFLWGYAIAVGRSRSDAIGMGGLFFLQGSAPRRVQRHLLGDMAVQVVVAVATAAVHPFTSQAFVILAPMFGLGLTGLWGARHGTFPPRPADDRS